MSYNFTQSNEELSAAKEWLQGEYSRISTGRANPALLDSVNIDSYGSQQPIKNVAAMTIEEARTLRIVPWDKSQIKDIEKAIIESKLPFSIAVDGEGLRASIPQLTEENKKTVVKLLKDKLEEARVRVRQIRQKIDKDIDAGDFSDDEKHGFKDSFQKTIDATNKELEEIFSAKETDVMSV